MCSDDAYKKFNGKDELIRDSLCGNDIRQKVLRIMSDSLSAAGGFVELQKLVSDSESKTVFDFDFSDSSNDEELKKKALLSINSLLPKDDCGMENYLKTTMKLPEGESKDFFAHFIARIILIYMRNAVKLPGQGTNLPDGGLFLPFVALFNHSCDPNIYASFVDNKCLITVIKPIRTDEQLFVNYRWACSSFIRFFVITQLFTEKLSWSNRKKRDRLNCGRVTSSIADALHARIAFPYQTS